MQHQLAKPNERPVVILSSGRSGSTLFQKLLNTHPELTIFGEHAGFLNGLAAAWRAVIMNEWIPDDRPRGAWLLESDRPIEPQRWTAWDGSFSKRDFERQLKTLVDALFLSHVDEKQRWGFKEIRYSRTSFFEFFLKLYPSTQFILLLRNPLDSCVSFAFAAINQGGTKSDHITEVSKVAATQIKPFLEFYRTILTQFRGCTHTIFFEELIRSPLSVLQDLSEWLRLETSFNSDAVTSIMDVDIVSVRQRANPEELEVLRKCAFQALEEEVLWYQRLVDF